jgi:hypothetical protein
MSIPDEGSTIAATKSRSEMWWHEKLEIIMDRCPDGFSLMYNPHADVLLSIKTYLKAIAAELMTEMSEETCAEIIASDRLFHILMVAKHPSGEYSVAHHDLDKALDLCLDILGVQGRNS